MNNINKLKRIVNSKKRSGSVYLLKNTLGHYKYGATTQRIERRISQINSHKKSDYKLLVMYETDDLLNSETRIKWDVINNVSLDDGTVEYFTLNEDGLTELEIRNCMRQICRVI